MKSSPINLVTEIDRGAEALVVERIHHHFPDHSILAEEGGAMERSRTHRWVIDPLDGTTNFVHGVPLRVSATSSLADSLLATGFPYTVSVAPDNNLPEHAAFTRRSRIVRELGTAAITLAWVAAGRLDGFWELVLGPWDVAAGGLLVEEAGGRITSLEDGPVDRAAPAVVASNGAIHDEMITTLKEVRAQ